MNLLIEVGLMSHFHGRMALAAIAIRLDADVKETVAGEH